MYNRLTIDLNAIRKNLQQIQSTLPPEGKIMPMIKAQAYGTNAAALLPFLKQWGIEIVGVSHVQEAIALRQKGCDLAIFAIHAATFELALVVQHDIEVAISDLLTCRLLQQEAAKAGKKIKVHLHVNTGMHRFGCCPSQALFLAQSIQQASALELVGIMTHFVAAENQTFDSYTFSQIALFQKTLETLKKEGISPPWVHSSNSAGVLRFAQPCCNMVRVGLATFGIYSSQEEKKELTLENALTLESTIIAINECPSGESVGYLRSYVAQKSSERIAILPIGYHDGLHLKYSGKGHVLIHGKKAPYVGRICMDFMMINVSDIEAQVGDVVLVFGKDSQGHTLEVEQVADFAKTNVRELLVSLGPRIERHFTTTDLHGLVENKVATPLLPI